MNYQELFNRAKEKGIKELEVSIITDKSLSITYYNGEMENYSSSSLSTLSARGNYNNKAGYVNTEKIDKSTIDFIVDKIIENAEVNNSSDELIIFKGSEKYHHKKVYSHALENTSPSVKIDLVKSLCEKTKVLDPRITDVSVSYSESGGIYEIMNSYGLKLKSKTNGFFIVVEVIAREGDTTKTGYKVVNGQDLNILNPDKIASEAVEKTVSQFNSIIAESKVYPCILANNVASSLLGFFLSHTIADEVQKGTSMFKGQLNQKVASNKITIDERPLDKGLNFRSFDDEGVATNNFTIISRGILKTYVYNLATAKKDKVESTGNGYRGSGKVVTSFANCFLKKGKKSLDDLFSIMQDGIYITNVEGLHGGMNGQSGNFSLQASGYLVENGKRSTPVSLITIGGNIFTLFNQVKEIGNDLELLGSVNSPSLLIKEITVSGK